ncbi:hypothetical protein AVEN_22282-1 [Araneus ventricosus]|uniref:Uncharacterized protein n=1 Tax=Araneus ventricosus TaxID=182803 RepID=A0A4Y2HU77_ARAVE|nr:hypothetical protein AVEN_22282-1 [Araneus ventricosus]
MSSVYTKRVPLHNYLTYLHKTEIKQLTENNFILQLKESNELTDQERLFSRKKGEAVYRTGFLQCNKNYQEIKDKKRLRCGFNSFRFKEFLEPMRCFGCYRFGHLKEIVEKPNDLKLVLQTMIRKDAQKTHPICVKFVLYNKSTNLKAELTICQIQTYPCISVR